MILDAGFRYLPPTTTTPTPTTLLERQEKAKTSDFRFLENGEREKKGLAIDKGGSQET